MGVGIYLRNCTGTLTDGRVNLSQGTGYVIEDCNGLVVDGISAEVGYGKPSKLVGRNDPCPCGSNIKYKKCHLGKVMAIGIKSSNSSSVFKDLDIKATDIGIHLDNDRSSFEKVRIDAGKPLDVKELIDQLGLPAHTPPEYVEEAVKQASVADSQGVLEESKLKAWLVLNGFNMASWASIAVSLYGLFK